MRFTVRELASRAGVTPRTLHYYDEIGLLRPSSLGDNGYRYYDEQAALRLQQVLFYRELDLSLSDIKAVLDDPGFDAREALLAHRSALEARARQLHQLILTIDKTISHLEGEQTMNVEELFGGFDNVQEKQWTQAAVAQYGFDNALVQESARRWRGYSAADRARIKEEGEAVYREFADLIGADPAGPDAQAAVARWRNHLRSYYEPTTEVLAGLGQGYAEDPAFRATFEAIHPDLPEFLRDAIGVYVAKLG